jgi:sialidase-1
VRTTGAYNDGQWHHAVLRRDGGTSLLERSRELGGGQLTLTVDGTSFSTPDVPGSVSRNSPFGVHVGERMDSRAHFSGAIDEVRVQDRALSDDELNTPVTTVTPDTVLWLPMDRVRGGH